MSKPKTIADLKINWNFNFETYLDFDIFQEHFKERNQNLKNYSIIKNIYHFNVVENNKYLCNFSSNNFLTSNLNLIELIFEIDWEISLSLFQNPKNYSYSLERFEKINDVKYNIILKKVEKCRF